MSVLVSLTICLSAAIGVLQLSGFYCVGQAALIQNSNEQRICPVCKGWTEAFFDVPLYTFLGEGDNSFPLPPRQGGGIIMAEYTGPFYCFKIAYGRADLFSCDKQLKKRRCHSCLSVCLLVCLSVTLSF